MPIIAEAFTNSAVWVPDANPLQRQQRARTAVNYADEESDTYSRASEGLSTSDSSDNEDYSEDGSQRGEQLAHIDETEDVANTLAALGSEEQFADPR